MEMKVPRKYELPPQRNASADYVAPSLDATAFHCPHCGAFANQIQFDVAVTRPQYGHISVPWIATHCAHCSGLGWWTEGRLVWPSIGAGPIPHPKMPGVVREDFDEAREIAGRSPRAAAALLRLSLQKLCAHLGTKSDNLNAAIGELVQRGLTSNVQKALDVVRISGNNALHPGELDLKDDHETVAKLFRLVNFVVQQMIADPDELNEIWGKMPERARAATEKRDAK